MSEFQDSLDWTPEMALQNSIECVRETDPDACIVIFLWKPPQEYNTKFTQSGLSLSEIVTLLEVQKSRIINMMNSKD